jgi:hypothetical protein
VSFNQRGRLGALVQHARHDSKETTRAARTAFAEKFLREVDPDGVLPEAERIRRADAARRAHFARMTVLSIKARRSKRMVVVAGSSDFVPDSVIDVIAGLAELLTEPTDSWVRSGSSPPRLRS